MFKNKKFILPANRLKLCGNCVFPQNFLTRKLSEILYFTQCQDGRAEGYLGPFQRSMMGFFCKQMLGKVTPCKIFPLIS